MSITSGIGLISGINTAQLIDQLLAIESRPKQLVQKQVATLQTQQVAYQDVNAKLLVLKLSAESLAKTALFGSTSATSSNESVFTASSSSSAVPGSYQFTVDRLVGTQQLITRGFADRDTTPVAPAGGTLTFEFGDAKLSTNTSLSVLNGGTGVTRGSIRVTDRSGNTATVDLSRALTINDVIDAINNTSGVNVTASVDGDGLVLTDNTAGIGTLSVANVGTADTASDLGLTVAAVGGTITGGQINRIGESTLLATLNDSLGVRINASQADFNITSTVSGSFDVDLAGAADLGDVIEKINTATGGLVTAQVSASGTSLELVDSGGSDLAVTALNGSNAAADLGILGAAAGGTLTGSRVVAAINSRLVSALNGGNGAGLGQIGITNRAGVASNIDLTGLVSVSQVIDAINDNATGVTASLNAAGNGILLTDTTGSTSGDLVVADVTGTAAADLKLAGSFASATKDSGNLQLKYISESTLLTSLNSGAGIQRGKFTLTDSAGLSATVDLTQGDETTIQDVLDEINSRGLSLVARVNDNGDGILIEDTGPGIVAVKVEESGSTTAKDLGLLGEAGAAGENLLGSFEKTVTIEADDTLDDIVSAINNAGLKVKATVINDGSAAAPFRISLLSSKEGRAGAFVFDDGGVGLDTATLTEAKDAVLFYGSADPARAIAITSTTNTLSSLVPGATINLLGTSTGPVSLNIARDDSAIVEAVQKFVTDFNAVVDAVNKYDKYDAETETRGLLLGDSTLSIVRSSLYRLVNNRNTDVTGRYSSIVQVGIKIGSGAKLQFDESKLRAALESDPDAVQTLFTFKETQTDSEGVVTTTAGGFGVRFDELVERLTDSVNGTLTVRMNSVDDLIELGNDRIEQYDVLLAAKRARLEAQFVAMESALAQMQGQSNALTSLQGLAASSATRAASSGGGS